MDNEAYQKILVKLYTLLGLIIDVSKLRKPMYLQNDDEIREAVLAVILRAKNNNLDRQNLVWANSIYRHYMIEYARLERKKINER